MWGWDGTVRFLHTEGRRGGRALRTLSKGLTSPVPRGGGDHRTSDPLSLLRVAERTNRDERDQRGRRFQTERREQCQTRPEHLSGDVSGWISFALFPAIEGYFSTSTTLKRHSWVPVAVGPSWGCCGPPAGQGSVDPSAEIASFVK